MTLCIFPYSNHQNKDLFFFIKTCFSTYFDKKYLEKSLNILTNPKIALKNHAKPKSTWKKKIMELISEFLGNFKMKNTWKLSSSNITH